MKKIFFFLFVLILNLNSKAESKISNDIIKFSTISLNKVENKAYKTEITNSKFLNIPIKTVINMPIGFGFSVQIVLTIEWSGSIALGTFHATGSISVSVGWGPFFAQLFTYNFRQSATSNCTNCSYEDAVNSLQINPIEQMHLIDSEGGDIPNEILQKGNFSSKADFEQFVKESLINSETLKQTTIDELKNALKK